MAATLPSRRPPAHHKSVSPQRVAQYDPYAHQLGSLSENVHRLLTERECAIYDRALTDYHRRRHIRAFVECLSHVLNTNQKRQLLIPIRDSYIKPSDLSKFNQLALEYGLATPVKKKKSESKDGVKKIEIKRNLDGEWGFNIRGGSEHGIGIFVSSVEPGSNAAKGGLKAGDQIKKANDLNCESVTHHEAVSMMRNSKKLQLWVLSRGHIPTSRMAHKVYNWVDPEGRPASPPPDPFEVQEQLSSSSKTLMNQPDERKVTMMIENGQELGISIRGGAEHGLGIYVSAVQEGSVAETYGVNVGDQIMEVNGINFLGIVHSDAAHALRAQPCMVLKLKDVGKLPHSRVTTLGKTQWHPTSGSRTLPSKGSRSPVFSSGYGTQMMLSDQENSFQVRGMMNEVARSVLTPQELNTFNYYVDQYDQNSLSVDDLVTPMLHLLTTPEKLQLLSEMHVVIKPRDLQRFNELTVHKALAVKKAGMYHSRSGDPYERSFSPGGVHSHSHSTPKSKGPMKKSVVAQVHPEEQPNVQLNSFEAEDHTLTHDSSSEDGGRDIIPQRLSPKHATFHPPPPPPSGPRNGHAAAKNSSVEDTWSATWNESSMMSPPPKGGGSADAESSVNVSEIEERVRSETEVRLRREFEEQQQKFMDEQQRRLKQEQAELEEKLRRDAEESMKKQLREKEEALARMTLQHQDKGVTDKAELEEEIKKELEEKIWREAEEHLRDEFEKKMQRELGANEATDTGADMKVNEEQIRREMEQKYKREYEEKMRREQEKWKKKEEEERRKQEQEAKARRDAEVARLEAEEQARIELEDRIRKKAEASARAEYEARLQHETEERARLAEEVKARKAMEERMEKERRDREKEQERERQRQREKEREREREKKEREKKERELAEAKKAAINKQMQDPLNFEIPAEETVEDYESSEEEEEQNPEQMTPEELEEQRMLEIQRRKRIQEEKEEQRKQEAQKRAQAAEKAKQDEEQRKKRELARRREANIRKMEAERKQKEAVAKQKMEAERQKRQQKAMEEKESTLERDRRLQSKKKQEEEAERQKGRAEAERIRKQKEEQEQRKKAEANRMAKMGGKQVMVGGAAKNGASPLTRAKKQIQPPKSKAAAIEEERDKAEQMLERKLREKKEAAAAATAKAAEQEQEPSADAGPSFSYAGYDNLRGELKHVQVTKVVRKLGIAIDGGANTKQKAVIIREISPEGCAGQTAPDLKVNQQLLEVEGQSLQGIKHKDVVMCIKHAFEGELGKVIDFTVLDPYN